MKIGIDIDDCIAKTVEYYCTTASTLFHRSMCKDDLIHKSGKLEQAGLVNEEEFHILKGQLANQGFVKNLELHEFSHKVLNRLYTDKHTLFLITSRDDYTNIEADTLWWLRKHTIPYHELIFTCNKKDAISSNDIDIFVDDRINFIEQAVNTATRVILFDQPWNRHSHNADVHRVNDWSGIYNFISTMV